MEQNNLSENQRNFLVEQFKHWGTNPLLLEGSWKVKITKEELESLIRQKYLVNPKFEDGKIKYNLSIKGQRFAEAYLIRQN